MFGKRGRPKKVVDESINIELPEPPAPLVAKREGEVAEPEKLVMSDEEKSLIDEIREFRKYALHTDEEFSVVPQCVIDRLSADAQFMIWRELKKLNALIEDMQ